MSFMGQDANENFITTKSFHVSSWLNCYNFKDNPRNSIFRNSVSEGNK